MPRQASPHSKASVHWKWVYYVELPTCNSCNSFKEQVWHVTLIHSQFVLVGAKKKRVASDDLVQTWIGQFPWAELVAKDTDGKPLVCCVPCRDRAQREHTQNPPAMASTRGTRAGDKNTLTRHADSGYHKETLERLAAKQNLGKGFKRMEEQNRAELRGVIPILLAATLYMCQNSIAGRQFPKINLSKN